MKTTQLLCDYETTNSPHSGDDVLHILQNENLLLCGGSVLDILGGDQNSEPRLVNDIKKNGNICQGCKINLTGHLAALDKGFVCLSDYKTAEEIERARYNHWMKHGSFGFEVQTIEETIRCPNCEAIQDASVTFYAGVPYPAYVHTCTGCDYFIMESEWETIKTEEVKL